MELPLIQKAEDTAEGKELGMGHVKFKVPVSHPSGDKELVYLVFQC